MGSEAVEEGWIERDSMVVMALWSCEPHNARVMVGRV